MNTNGSFKSYWLRGGLIGLGIGIVLMVTDYFIFKLFVAFNGLIVYFLFSDFLIKTGTFHPGESLQGSALYGLLLYPLDFLAFFISGAFAGFIMGRWKSKI